MRGPHLSARANLCRPTWPGSLCRDGEGAEGRFELGGEELGAGTGPVVRGELEVARVGPARQHAHHFLEVLFGVEGVEAAGRNEREDGSGSLRVLDDGRLPLDNTRSERSLRKIVVGRNYAESSVMRSHWGPDGRDSGRVVRACA
jgi:hypothetical protein